MRTSTAVTGLEDAEPRWSARVLLVDDRDRVLPFEHVVRAPGCEHETVWNTVGGGIDPGETTAEAAAREVREETGLSVPAGFARAGRRGGGGDAVGGAGRARRVAAGAARGRVPETPVELPWHH